MKEVPILWAGRHVVHPRAEGAGRTTHEWQYNPATRRMEALCECDESDEKLYTGEITEYNFEEYERRMEEHDPSSTSA